MTVSEEEALRTYLVMGTDVNGDAHMFATDNLARAEAKLAAFQAELDEVRANWRENGSIGGSA